MFLKKLSNSLKFLCIAVAGGIYLVYLFGKQFCKSRRYSLKESNDNEESLIEKIGISSDVINDKDRDSLHSQDCFLKTDIPKSDSNQSQSDRDNIHLHDSSLKTYISKPVSNQSQSPIRPPSLTNVGANCYLNAAIQGISSCNIFVNDIKGLHLREDLHCNDNLDKLFIFQTLINILNGGSVSRLEISRNSIFKNWNKPGQQDSYELLAYVINQVYNDIRKHLETQKLLSRSIQDWLKIPLPLRILIEYNIKCGCGLFVEAPLQSDLALHVPMSANTRKNLQSLVDGFFKNDIIEDYICDKKSCDGKGATRQTKLRLPLPKTICIHLQRTFWNGYKMLKIGTRINFDKNLIIKSKYCSTKENHKKLITEQVQYIENSSSEYIFDKPFGDSTILDDTVHLDITAKRDEIHITPKESVQDFHPYADIPYTNSIENTDSITEVERNEIKSNLVTINLSQNNNALASVNSSDSINRDETNSSSENNNAVASVDLADIRNEGKANIIANEGEQNFDRKDNLSHTNNEEKTEPITEPDMTHKQSWSLSETVSNDDNKIRVDAKMFGNHGDKNADQIHTNDREKILIKTNFETETIPDMDAHENETNSLLENNNALTSVNSSDSINRDETNSSLENNNAVASVDLADIRNEGKANIIANEGEQNFDRKDNLSHTNNEEKTEPITEPDMTHKQSWSLSETVSNDNKIRVDAKMFGNHGDKNADQIHTNDKEKILIKTNFEREKMPDMKPNTFPESGHSSISLNAETTVSNDYTNIKFEGDQDSSKSEDESMHNDEIQDKQYALCSVIVHYGSVYGGHYVCYKLVDNRWFLTDDSRIKEVTEAEVFGCEAYILFYEEL